MAKQSRKMQIFFLLLGAAVFIYLVDKFGVGRIAENIEKAGWSLLYIIIVWLVIYLLNALSWKIGLGEGGKDIPFGYMFMVTVTGFGINYITPFIALGGEAYKVKALVPALGPQNSLSAVILYRMLHLLGHMAVLLTGVIAGLLFLDLPLATVIILVAIGALIVFVILLVLQGSRHGIFSWLQRLLSRIRLLRRYSEGLDKYEHQLEDMDTLFTHTYRNRKGQFILSVLCEYGGRLLQGWEVYLILGGIGMEITAVSALFIYFVYSVMINILFFIPMNIGAREGGLLLGLESLALPPLLGIYLGIVMRIREFFWILLGLLFIPLTTPKEKVGQ